MHDDAAFRAAIAATPDDHAVRLVYANWLDEQDRPDVERHDVLREWRQQGRWPVR